MMMKIFMILVIMQVTLHAGLFSAIAKIAKITKTSKTKEEVVLITKTHKTIRSTRSNGVVTFRKERTTPIIGRVELKKDVLNKHPRPINKYRKPVKVIIMNNRVPKPRLSLKERERLNIRGKEILDQLAKDKNFKDWLAPSRKNKKTRKTKKKKR